MRLAITLLALLLFSCKTPSIPEAPRVAPAVERIAGPLEASGDAAAAIKDLLSKAQADLSQRRIEALTFKSEMERWRAEGMTKDEELSKVWEELNKQTRRNLFLEENLAATSVVVSELETSLAAAREATSNALSVATHKDAESVGLRESNDKLNARLDAASKKLASANVYKRMVLAIAVGLGILWVLREIVPLVLKVAKPL